MKTENDCENAFRCQRHECLHSEHGSGGVDTPIVLKPSVVSRWGPDGVARGVSGGALWRPNDPSTLP